MTNKEQTRIFQKNLLKYLHESHKSQTEVAQAIGVNHQTFSTWCTGIAYPRMGKVQALADYFHINKSDLIEDKDSYEADDMTKAMELYNKIQQLPQDKQDALNNYLRFLQSEL